MDEKTGRIFKLTMDEDGVETGRQLVTDGRGIERREEFMEMAGPAERKQ